MGAAVEQFPALRIVSVRRQAKPWITTISPSHIVFTLTSRSPQEDYHPAKINFSFRKSASGRLKNRWGTSVSNFGCYWTDARRTTSIFSENTLTQGIWF